MLMAVELWYRRLCRYWVTDLESSDLTPGREEELVRAFIHDLGGADPDRLGDVSDLLALALASSGWRSTCVERWYATGRIGEGDMMRVNSYTAWSVRQRVRRWMGEVGLGADMPVTVLDKVDDDAVYRLLTRVCGWLIDRHRRLPCGVTLGALASADLPAYAMAAGTVLTAFGSLTESRGARFAFSRGAAHAALACRRWWGHPNWPVTVDWFARALDNPADRRWGEHGDFRCQLPPEPPDIADRYLLRKTLLTSPWRLSPDAATWVASSGMGYLYYLGRRRTPALPGAVASQSSIFVPTVHAPDALSKIGDS
jgi:hypothetical protein